MGEYEMIQENIRQARVERGVYVGSLLSHGVARMLIGVQSTARKIVLAAKAKRAQPNVFTFDA